MEIWLRDGRRFLDAVPVCCLRRAGIISGIAILFIINKCGAMMMFEETDVQVAPSRSESNSPLSEISFILSDFGII